MREKTRPQMEIVKELENGNLPLPPEREWKQAARRRR
jgi:hypothetical protein